MEPSLLVWNGLAWNGHRCDIRVFARFWGIPVGKGGEKPAGGRESALCAVPPQNRCVGQLFAVKERVRGLVFGQGGSIELN